jgi:phosphoglycolate phosphatase-like HAD superfamily hydrolase
VSVRIEENGKTTVGQAADTDTLVASANAYINALNKMIIKKIEEVENEIINNNISLSSIERQEEIKVKLLELEKAAKEQEEEERRESKESIDEYKKNNSLLFEEYLKIKQEETELLKTIPPNLKPYYKNKVNEYIKSIEIDYD